MRSSVLLILLLIAVVAIVAWAISLYNRLVSRRNHVEDGWSGVDVQLKRRHDLIPNLVSVVKKYASHEEQTLSRIVELRNQKVDKTSPQAYSDHEQKLGQAIGGLMVQVEAYPDLKADSNFKELQQQLYKIEEDIQYARRYYNGAVRQYNTLVQSFPSNMIAQRYEFAEAEFFELEDEVQRQAPKVDF